MEKQDLVNFFAGWNIVNVVLPVSVTALCSIKQMSAHSSNEISYKPMRYEACANADQTTPKFPDIWSISATPSLCTVWTCRQTLVERFHPPIAESQIRHHHRKANNEVWDKKKINYSNFAIAVSGRRLTALWLHFPWWNQRLFIIHSRLSNFGAYRLL